MQPAQPGCQWPGPPRRRRTQVAGRVGETMLNSGVRFGVDCQGRMQPTQPGCQWPGRARPAAGHRWSGDRRFTKQDDICLY
jgi:hypothetical protein